MPATIKTTPGLRLTAYPGLPVAAPTAEEIRIASLPGLIHCFEPDQLAGSPLAGIDRATVGWPLATTDATITLGAEADYDDQIVAIKPSAGAPFEYGVGTCPAGSFTAIIVADILAARLAAGSTSHLFSMVDGTTILRSWRLQNGGAAFKFVDNYAAEASVGNNLLVASAPAGDAPAVWVCSYDAETRISRLGINSSTVIAQFTHATAAAMPGPNARFILGGSTGSHWAGRLGRALLLGANYHDAAYLALLDREIAAAKAKYGIA